MLAEEVSALQDCLLREYGFSPGMFAEVARMEGLLAETYRDRIQYELLQNSDDAGSHTVVVQVASDGVVTWANDGRPLDSRDAEALCRSASSTKSRGESIGYRGIGFKSLAAVARRISVQSGGARFTFDRRKTVELLVANGHTLREASVPLIRIPTDVVRAPEADGVTFTITPSSPGHPILGEVDPTALLFLKSVFRVALTAGGRTSTFLAKRSADTVEIAWDGLAARFALLRGSTSTVAIPLDQLAVSLATLQGRLACFLPLSDHLRLPLIVSGDLLTDPSRTSAIVADESTKAVLRESSGLFAKQLADPAAPLFQRCWELLVMAEDPRSTLMAPTDSAGRQFLQGLRDALSSVKLPFQVSPIQLSTEDVAALFPSGAPIALYRGENAAAARSLRIAFNLPALDVAKAISRVPAHALSGQTLESAAEHVSQLVKALGRVATAEESAVIALRRAAPTAIESAHRTPAAHTERASDQFSQIVQRWRVAEISVMNFLNSAGWHLSDVSAQNLGYDLKGTDPDGQPVAIEVKKVDRPDSRFSMTNNEMSLMQSGTRRYIVGLVIGDGRYARLMLLDPSSRALPRERVCRRWEWEFTSWSRYGTYVG